MSLKPYPYTRLCNQLEGNWTCSCWKFVVLLTFICALTGPAMSIGANEDFNKLT